MTATISGSATSTLVALTTTGNTILGDASTDTLNVGNGDLVKDASGNVGIGTTAPLAKLQISAVTPVLTGGYSQLNIFSTNAIGANQGGRISLGGVSGATGFDPYGFCAIAGLKENATASNFAGYLTFATSNSGGTVTERARLDSSGYFMVGTTTNLGNSSVLSIKQSIAGNPATFQNGSDAGWGINFLNVAGSSAGSISWTATTTTFSTSSDYRLKEAISPMTGALARVNALKPCTYKWKLDGSDGQGFIAHELQAIVPECVIGEKDAVDADGNPKYQGIDTSFLVATLTAAIQEQQALITSLTTRLTALENK